MNDDQAMPNIDGTHPRGLVRVKTPCKLRMSSSQRGIDDSEREARATDRPLFTSKQAYAQTFTSAAFWQPYIEHVWTTAELGRVEHCAAGLPGTNPVFLVNHEWIIKFFTDLFGFHSDQVELAFYRDVQPCLDVPTPTLLTSGHLFEPDPAKGWHYPYIVTTRVTGISYGEWEHQTVDSLTEAARFAARALRAFHDFSLNREGVLAADWTAFEKLLATRRTAMRSRIEALPAHPQLREELLHRLSERVQPYDATATPSLLHGDLNRDHLLGIAHGGGAVEFTGVIDFGDVKAGDPLYDLVPLHFGLFETDKSILSVFLDAYGDGKWGSRFAQRAMDYTLLYESDVLSEWFAKREERRTLSSLEQLQHLLWEI